MRENWVPQKWGRCRTIGAFSADFGRHERRFDFLERRVGEPGPVGHRAAGATQLVARDKLGLVLHTEAEEGNPLCARSEADLKALVAEKLG